MSAISPPSATAPAISSTSRRWPRRRRLTAESDRPSTPARRWALDLALGVFLAGLAALASPWLLGWVTIPWDAKAHFYPQLVFLAKSLHAGDSPFWNPHVFAGHPQIADPQSLIFSPPFLLLAALNPAPSMAAFDATVFALLGLGGVGVILIFRDRGWHEAAAVVAALAFAFGGSAAWRVQHVGQITSLAWLPLALWAFARALERRSFGWGLAAGLFAGLMALGRDQVALLGLWALAGFALAHFLASPRLLAALAGAVKPIAGGVLAGLLVAGLPTAMTLALALQSNRPSIDFAGAGRGSLHPASLLTFFAANLFGTDGPLADFWGPPSPIWGPVDLYLARNMSDLYQGAIPALALAAIVLARGLWREAGARYFAAGLVVALVYALGRYTPAYHAIFVIPGADLFRRPADATFLVGFFAACLAGYGVHRWLAGDLPPASWLTRLLVVGVFAALTLAALALAFDKGMARVAFPALRMAALCFAAAAAALWLARRLAPRGALAPMLLLGAVLVADLAVNNGPNESTALPPATYAALDPAGGDSTVALIAGRLAATSAPDRRDRVELAAIDFHWPNASMSHGFDNVLGYNPLRLALFTAATNAGDHVALADQRQWSPLFASYASPMADLLGLRWIVTGPPPERIDRLLPGGVLVPAGRTDVAIISENPRALPRVVLATQAMQADFAQMIRTGVWPLGDYRSMVLLEAPSRPATGQGAAKLLSYRNTEVVAEATAPAGGGWLVLFDVDHPWWFAEIDGAPTPILRADVMFRAVAVPEGQHVVRFVFRPFAGLWRQLTQR
ncbi:MAG: glycosyltransferase family 39 protein [Methylobacteriaceae bacterium]|nr:glycosyltransferase family 39 protein [Methylobacteriaceae bacterium]